MDLTEFGIIKKYAKKCVNCSQDILLPYEREWNCVLCGYNVIKWKHELSKSQRKKINFMNRLKYAEQKVFCFCIE